MKSSVKSFIQLIFIFAWLLFTGSCQQNTTFELKEGWKIVEKENFSFTVPVSFTEKEIQGYENTIWEFEDSNIFLFIDFGTHNGISEYIKNSPEYVEKRMTVNGQSALLISYFGVSRKNNSTELKPILALIFENPNYSNSNLLLEAKYENESDKNIILTIFDSVKIK